MKEYIILFTVMVLAVVFSAFTGTGGKMIVKIEKGELDGNRVELKGIQRLERPSVVPLREKEVVSGM